MIVIIFLIYADSSVVGDVGFKSIFNGESLEHWFCRPVSQQGNWKVEDETIIARGKGAESYLMFHRQLDNFELKFKYKFMSKTGNTGVEIRGLPVPGKASRLHGYHADIGHVGIGDQVLGAWDFHENNRGSYLSKRGELVIIRPDGSKIRNEIAGAFIPEDAHINDWNEVHVCAKDNVLWFSINGKMASIIIDNEGKKRLDKGFIGFQLHSGDQMVVAFKDILLKE